MKFTKFLICGRCGSNNIVETDEKNKYNRHGVCNSCYGDEE